MLRDKSKKTAPPQTLDGRYTVVRGRLWRLANPHLTSAEREALVGKLMDGRRAVKNAKRANDAKAEQLAHEAVDQAKHALGERGPVWRSDGAPNYNRHMAPYADWFAALPEEG